MTAATSHWWADAVFYEVYVRSFADSDGDGVGDLAGFDALVADAHALALRVTVDLVPNHTSDRHPWFQAALAAPPGSRERDRYLFGDGRGPGGDEPPNNWDSVFGGPAWTRVTDDGRPGQWYLHLFAPEQPDLNWRNAEVRADYERTLRFWLDRGADGFRIDVAHGLVKDGRLRDNPGRFEPDRLGHGENDRHSWDQPEVHDIYRSWRRVLDSYDGDRMAVGEVWLRDVAATARYVRPDELHLAFNFRLLLANWDAAGLRAAADASMAAMAAAGAPTTWVLSNHDVTRVVTRYGRADTSFSFESRRAGLDTDLQLGTRRARAAALLTMALPGSMYIYQGEELGLSEVDNIPDDRRQDPMFFRSGHLNPGRDGCRVPLPWSGEEPPYGFSPPGASRRPWLDQPRGWGPLTAAAESANPDSMLTLYRQGLELRKAEAGLAGEALVWVPAAPTVLAFSRGETFACAVNLGPQATSLPIGAEVLLASDSIEGGQLAPDTAVWLRTSDGV